MISADICLSPPVYTPLQLLVYIDMLGDIYIYIYIYVYIYVYMYVYVYTHVCIYIYTHQMAAPIIIMFQETKGNI